MIHHTNREVEKIRGPPSLDQDCDRKGNGSPFHLRRVRKICSRNGSEHNVVRFEDSPRNLRILLPGPESSLLLDDVEVLFRPQRMPWSGGQMIPGAPRHRLLLEIGRQGVLGKTCGDGGRYKARSGSPTKQPVMRQNGSKRTSSKRAKRTWASSSTSKSPLLNC